MNQFHEYFAQLLAFLDSLRWYHYLGLFIVYVLIFGKKKVIDFEAKLFAEGGNDIIGELEIEKFEKENISAHLRLDNIKQLYGKNAEIFIDNYVVSKFQLDESGTATHITYPTLETGKNQLFRHSNARKWNNVELPLSEDLKPANNQHIEIKVNGQLFAHGILLKD